MAGKTAIVLVIRDESGDLPSWLAWYVACGIDTIFVFDDGSTDDTYRVAQLAAFAFDIRVARLHPDERFYVDRQRETYIHVLRHHADEFAWIGFFDADEYLDLQGMGSVGQLLDVGEDVGSVAVHWRNYGSSGHLLKPYDRPFDAYTYHFLRSELIGRHVKSFVRPRDWTGRWLNMHCFDVGGKRCVDPDGNDVVWSGEPGITATDATWARASVLHFQGRSLEHFIERLRKRPDLPRSLSMWTIYDRNDVHARLPPERTQDAVVALRRIAASAARIVLRSMKEPDDLLPARSPRQDAEPRADTHAGSGENGAPDTLPEFAVHHLITDQGLRVGVDASGALLVGDEGRNLAPCFLVLPASAPTAAFLVAPIGSRLLQMKGERRVALTLAFDLVGRGNARLHLRNPSSRAFLTAIPVEHGGMLVCDRLAAGGWETFTVEPVASDLAAAIVRSLRLHMLRRALINVSAVAAIDDDLALLDLLPLFFLLGPASVTGPLKAGFGSMISHLI